MAKFIYEVRVKNTNCKLVAQYVCLTKVKAREVAIAAVAKVAGVKPEDVRSDKDNAMWVGIYKARGENGDSHAFIYRNLDGNNVLPSADTIGNDNERMGL